MTSVDFRLLSCIIHCTDGWNLYGAGSVRKTLGVVSLRRMVCKKLEGWECPQKGKGGYPFGGESARNYSCGSAHKTIGVGMVSEEGMQKLQLWECPQNDRGE